MSKLKLDRLHKLVQAVHPVLQSGLGDWNTGICKPSKYDAYLDVAASHAALDRVLSIADAILKECERRGYSVTAKEPHVSGTYVTIRDVSVGLRVVEKA